ncbi:hypothetical protein LY76DRAFT_173868 [Colletotrichum caudatum]|nr:hypothetical protein LY76DRAFT_173868 [Colletotrichum caudatum]
MSRASLRCSVARRPHQGKCDAMPCPGMPYFCFLLGGCLPASFGSLIPSRPNPNPFRSAIARSPSTDSNMPISCSTTPLRPLSHASFRQAPPPPGGGYLDLFEHPQTRVPRRPLSDERHGHRSRINKKHQPLTSHHITHSLFHRVLQKGLKGGR